MVATLAFLSATTVMASSLHRAGEKASTMASHMHHANNRMLSVTKMERDWRETARKVQVGKTKVDDTVLDEIKETMDSIYSECQSSYQAAQTMINNRHAAVAACRTTKTSEWATVDAEYEMLRVKAVDFKLCMDNLCVAEDIRIETCGARDDKATEAHTNIPDCSGGSATCGPAASTCESCTVSAKTWHDTYYTDLVDLINECVQESANVTEQDADCAAKHPVYENDWCAWNVTIAQTCERYDVCYDQTTQAYNVDTANMTDLTSTNINVCYATEKIKCWVDTISTCQGSTDTEACDAARQDCDITDDARFLGPCTEALTPEPFDPVYEARDPCDRSTIELAGLPDGDDSPWKAHWYDSANEFHGAICNRHNRLHPAVTSCPAFA